MIYMFFIFLHLIVSILLVIVILLQSSKGGGLAGSAFGGSGPASSFLGARGTATFLSRATTFLAVIFMLNSLGLSFLIRGASKPVSVTQQAIQSEAQHLPRVPGDVSIPMEGLPGMEESSGDLQSSTASQGDESSGSTEQTEQ